MSEPRYSPTWRTFVAWTDDDTDRPPQIQLDVRHVVSVVEKERRRAYGFVQPVAVIRLHDGHEFCVTDYQRKTAKTCAERDADLWAEGGDGFTVLRRLLTTLERAGIENADTTEARALLDAAGRLER